MNEHIIIGFDLGDDTEQTITIYKPTMFATCLQRREGHDTVSVWEDYVTLDQIVQWFESDKVSVKII